ncbi:MAG TPA: VWA domain-containing protein [Gammaproteobacteria bacterium]|nr:VWA domain-containing protein [Gammaproteobacteria bacterium]
MKHRHNTSMTLLLLSLSCLAVTVSAALPTSPVADIRVLIDVSGSMKQNDPVNLRRPALKLLVGLLPENSRSGIWMFGKYVNMQVKLGTVNRLWKEQARKAADTIHSRGLYTNIEDAIQRASTDWTTNDPAYNRNLILLTDGMVDVSKDESLDKASRQRILEKLLPRLRKAGVRIHTIALSDNADEELLKTLSLSTGGWFEKVLDANTLQRIFLRLFEQSTQNDTLPLSQNHFSVDSSITDMTLLVFQSDPQSPTHLSGPGNINWSAEQHPERVQWFHEQGYDMITVPKPVKGDWVIDAPVDDDNRVMVVTNLRLDVSPLPAHILLGDKVTVVSSLSENGKRIKRDDFLKLIQFTASQTLAKNSPASIHLLDNGAEPDTRANDGIFMASMPRVMTPGDIELQVDARSSTFSRQWRHQIKVYESAIKIDLRKHAGNKGNLLTIQQEPGLLQPESIKITTLLSGSELQLTLNDKDSTWQATIPALKTDQKLDILVRGLDYNNKLYEARIQRTIAAAGVPSVPSDTTQTDKTGNPQAPVANEPSGELAMPDSATIKTTAEPTATEQPKSSQSDKSSSRKWWLVTILVISINLLLAGGGYLLWSYWRTRKNKFDNDIEDELEYSTSETVLASEDSDTLTQESMPEEADKKNSEPEAEPEAEAEPSAAPAIPDAAELDKFLDSHKDMLGDPEVETISVPEGSDTIETTVEPESDTESGIEQTLPDEGQDTHNEEASVVTDPAVEDSADLPVSDEQSVRKDEETKK